MIAKEEMLQSSKEPTFLITAWQGTANTKLKHLTAENLVIITKYIQYLTISHYQIPLSSQ